MKRKRPKMRPWTPFVETVLDLPPHEEHVQQLFTQYGERMTREIAEREIEKLKGDRIFVNSRYQVNLHDEEDFVHLSIKTLDKRPARDWRDFQRIKNELVGEECEGLELFPAESRLIDTANQFHLWVYKDPTMRIPVGWECGRHVESTVTGGATQRPLEQQEATQ